MTPGIFVDKFMTIRVEDVLTRSDGKPHHPGEVYSTIKEFVGVRTP